MPTQPSSPCELKSNRSNATPTDFRFDDATITASSDLADGSQVGMQFFQDIKKLENRRVSLGYKMALNKSVNVKAKIDSNWNASFFGEYKFGNGLAIQETLSTNFVEDFKTKGFLENSFALGVKIKYDS